MIAFIQGVLAEKQPARVVVETGGLGYEIFIPLSSYDRLPTVGAACRILTVDHVREDAHLLFGFATAGERDLFQMLMSVTGIGPKIALSALSGLSVREIKAAIIEGDVKRLSSINGIGRKTAERMIVELRDRLSRGEALEAVAGADPATPDDLRMRDALLALIALGFKQDEARKQIEQASRTAGGHDLSVEELVRRCLGR